MTLPPMNVCGACLCDIERGEWTVDIEGEPVHDYCADDRTKVSRCAHCYQLAIREDAQGWTKHADGDLCPECAAALVAEHGSAEAVPSPLAGAVRSMAAILREVAS